MQLPGNLPNATSVQINGVPTWLIVNADSFLSEPLTGQFDPEIKITDGEPIWVDKPAILGGQPFFKYIGRGNRKLRFTFHGLAHNITDQYPAMALSRIQEFTAYDSTLGHPPRLYFYYGTTLVEGYITGLPEIPITYWPNTLLRLIREVGPIEVTMTLVPQTEVAISISTNYVVITDDLLPEETCLAQYDDPRFWMAISEYNQGKRSGDVLELPRKINPAVSRTVSVAAFLSTRDIISGL